MSLKGALDDASAFSLLAFVALQAARRNELGPAGAGGPGVEDGCISPRAMKLSGGVVSAKLSVDDTPE